MKTQVLPLIIAATIVSFGLLPKTQAVSPAPDGGYGVNTAEGMDALFSLTTGVWNTALGFQALYADTAGQDNTATGGRSLFSNTTGNWNTANGAFALYSNTVGHSNSAFGWGAMARNTSGVINTASGMEALEFNTTGSGNTATGFEALVNNTTGSCNTANGAGALADGTTGNGNTAIGDAALLGNTTGSYNTAIGNDALETNTTGGQNVGLGNNAGLNVTTANNVICIGAGVYGANVDNTCFIGNIRGTTTGNNNAIPVLIDSAGQLGTISSSRRFKTDVKPIGKASECVLGLKPVSFRYKVHKATTPQFGLIAEDVAKVNPDLVIYDADGKLYTVRYEAVNAMLLNEFLKEHRKVEQMQKQIEALTAGLRKVSAQVLMNRTTPQMVVNNQ